MLPFLIIVFAGFLWLNAWIEYVDPFPDRDAINQFYFPFLNYLQASKFISATPGFLTEVCFSGSYPTGSAIFPWLISVLGLQDSFINNPFQLYSILLIPVACIPYYFKINNQSRLLLGLVILALPITQISLKGFSLHSFNVFFALLAILSFQSYLEHKRFKDLAAFIFCFWIAVICKHLGAFYLLNFAFSYLIWSFFYSKQIDHRIVISIIVILAASLPFYPIEKLHNYLLGLITHNPHISLELFFTASFLLLVTAALILLMLKSFSSNEVKPTLNKGPLITFVLLGFATLLCMIPYDAYTGNINVILFFVIGYGLLAWLLMSYHIADARGFLYLFSAITYINSTLLYCSLIGKTYYIFFLPISLVAILEFLDTKSSFKRMLALLIAIVLSNFFPSIENLQKRLGDRGEDIYVNAFNSIYINPLGWENCEIPRLRREMSRIFSTVQINKNTDFYITENMHFQTKLSLEFPKNFFFPFTSIYRVDNLPKSELIKLYDEYKHYETNVFAKWVDQKQIPFLLIGEKPFIKNVENTPALEELIKSESFELRSFAQSLGSEYIKFLEKNHTFNKLYLCTLIPQKKSRLRVCTLKSLIVNNATDNSWNNHLIKIATDYEMEQSRPLPNWIKNLDEENQKRLLEKRAGTLYGELELESESLSIEKKYERLRKILELDPNHSGAKQDIEGLKEDSEKTEIRDPPDKNKAKNSSKIKTPSEQMFDLFKKANDQMESRNWLEAQKLLNKGLKIDPTHVEMLKDLDIVNKELENLQKRNP